MTCSFFLLLLLLLPFYLRNISWGSFLNVEFVFFFFLPTFFVSFLTSFSSPSSSLLPPSPSPLPLPSRRRRPAKFPPFSSPVGWGDRSYLMWKLLGLSALGHLVRAVPVGSFGKRGQAREDEKVRGWGSGGKATFFWKTEWKLAHVDFLSHYFREEIAINCSNKKKKRLYLNSPFPPFSPLAPSPSPVPTPAPPQRRPLLR